jgi:hypothetical protein
MESFKQFCEDLSGPVQGTPNPGQPQAQVPANARIVFMIRLANQVLGTSIPETEQGYNQLGRSDGIISELAKPNAWAKLKNSPAGDALWNSVPQVAKIHMLSTIISQTSR